MIASPRLGAGVVILAALALTGCTSAAAGSGPLTVGLDAGEACIALPVGEQIVVGEIVQSSSDASAHLVEFRPTEAAGVKVDEVGVMDPAKVAAIGALRPDEAEASWGTRVPIDAAEVDSSRPMNVAAVLTRTSDEPGVIEAFELTYEIDGARYSATSTTKFLLTDECS